MYVFFYRCQCTSIYKYSRYQFIYYITVYVTLRQVTRLTIVRI